MAFHHIRFPLDISVGARRGSQWATDIVQLASGAEERNSRWANSRRHYDVGFGAKSKTDLQSILAFFEERRGSFHGFLFRDPLDNCSGLGKPTAFDQKLAPGDNDQTRFQLIKKYGADFDPYYREITKPVKGTVLVAIDGSPVDPSRFTVDHTLGLVAFDRAPQAGARITAGFIFDVPVRFENDRLDIEISSFEAAIAPVIKLIEIR